MPYAVCSASNHPAPRPSSTRPALISSTWATAIASGPGRRNVAEVTRVPSRMVVVSRASPARVVQASVGPGQPVGARPSSGSGRSGRTRRSPRPPRSAPRRGASRSSHPAGASTKMSQSHGHHCGRPAQHRGWAAALGRGVVEGSMRGGAGVRAVAARRPRLWPWIAMLVRRDRPRAPPASPSSPASPSWRCSTAGAATTPVRATRGHFDDGTYYVFELSTAAGTSRPTVTPADRDRDLAGRARAWGPSTSPARARRCTSSGDRYQSVVGFTIDRAGRLSGARRLPAGDLGRGVRGAEHHARRCARGSPGSPLAGSAGSCALLGLVVPHRPLVRRSRGRAPPRYGPRCAERPPRGADGPVLRGVRRAGLPRGPALVPQ